MSALGEETSMEQDVRPARLKTHTAQVSILPFSVDALMSERRPLAAANGENIIYPLNDAKDCSKEEVSQQVLSVTSKSPEQGEGPSWKSSSMKMTTQPRKNNTIILFDQCFFNNCDQLYKSGLIYPQIEQHFYIYSKLP